MALSPGILNDVGLGFSSGKLSEKDYERRRDACTKQQLNELLASPEYGEWIRRGRGSTHSRTFGELGLVALAVLVFAAILAQPFVGSTTTVVVQENLNHDGPEEVAALERMSFPEHQALPQGVTHVGNSSKNVDNLVDELEHTAEELHLTETALKETQNVVVQENLNHDGPEEVAAEHQGIPQGVTHVGNSSENVDNLVDELEHTAEELHITETALKETQNALQTLLDINADMERSLLQAEVEIKQAKALVAEGVPALPAAEVPMTRPLLDFVPVSLRTYLPENAEAQVNGLIPYLLPAAVGSGLSALTALVLSLGIFFSSRHVVARLTNSVRQLRRALGLSLCMQAGAVAQHGSLMAKLKASGDALRELESAGDSLQIRASELRKELTRAKTAEGVKVKALCTQLASLEEERAAEVAQHERELSNLERQLADEVSRKEEAAAQAKRWLDQAQGQLQNTQTALTVKEAEVKMLSVQLDQAAADYASLRATSDQYAEQAKVAEQLRADLAERENECKRLSHLLAEAHDSLAALHLEAEEAADRTRVDAEAGLAAHEQDIALLKADLTAAQATAEELCMELESVRAEAANLQKALDEKTQECEAAGARVADFEEANGKGTAATSQCGPAEDADEADTGRDSALLPCNEELHAALVAEQDAHRRVIEQLFAAEYTIQQLQERVTAAAARESELMVSTKDAGRQVGSVMEMMKSTRQSLERKINASQSAFSALSAELSSRPPLLQRGQENQPPEGFEAADRLPSCEPRTPLQPAPSHPDGVNVIGKASQPAPSTNEDPLLINTVANPALAARIRTAARSPYWFAK